MCKNNDAEAVIVETWVSSVLGGWLRRAAKPCTTPIKVWAVTTTSPKLVFIVHCLKHMCNHAKHTLVFSMFSNVSAPNGAGSELGTASNPTRRAHGTAFRSVLSVKSAKHPSLAVFGHSCIPGALTPRETSKLTRSQYRARPTKQRPGAVCARRVTTCLGRINRASGVFPYIPKLIRAGASMGPPGAGVIVVCGYLRR